MSIEIIGIDHIYISVSDLNRSERFYDRMMKHCTFEMRYPPMTKHLSSSSFKACCSILGKSVRAPSWWKERATRLSRAKYDASGLADERGIVEREWSRELRRPQTGRIHEKLARAQIHPGLH